MGVDLTLNLLHRYQIHQKDESEQGASDRGSHVLDEQCLPSPHDDESWELEISEMAGCLLLADLETHELCGEVSQTHNWKQKRQFLLLAATL